MIGIVLNEANVPRLVDQIVEAEAMGVPAVWLTTTVAGRDALTVFAAAAVKTRSIGLGASILPIWPRHPVAVAQQAQVIAALAPRRLRIGLGVSEPDVEQMLGASWQAPLQHLREYIHTLKTLLQTGSVDFGGQQYTARARIAEPVDVPILAAALRAGAYRVCGEVSDGALSSLVPWSYIEACALPALHEGAAAAGRQAPPLLMHVPVCPSLDRQTAYAAAREQLGVYTQHPDYVAMFTDAGFDVSGGLPDALIDDLVVWGDEAAVAEGLRAKLKQGAAEIRALPLLIGDRAASLRAMLAAVAAANR